MNVYVLRWHEQYECSSDVGIYAARSRAEQDATRDGYAVLDSETGFYRIVDEASAYLTIDEEAVVE